MTITHNNTEAISRDFFLSYEKGVSSNIHLHICLNVRQMHTKKNDVSKDYLLMKLIVDNRNV